MNPEASAYDIGKDRDTVLFLGAGFSAHARLPVMSGFGKASDAELAGLQKHVQKSPRRSIGVWLEAEATFSNFRIECKNAEPFAEIDVNNMEEIFSIAEVLRECDLNIGGEAPVTDGE